MNENPQIGEKWQHKGTGVSGNVIGIFQDRSGIWTAQIERLNPSGRVVSDWFPFSELSRPES